MMEGEDGEEGEMEEMSCTLIGKMVEKNLFILVNNSRKPNQNQSHPFLPLSSLFQFFEEKEREDSNTLHSLKKIFLSKCFLLPLTNYASIFSSISLTLNSKSIPSIEKSTQKSVREWLISNQTFYFQQTQIIQILGSQFQELVQSLNKDPVSNLSKKQSFCVLIALSEIYKVEITIIFEKLFLDEVESSSHSHPFLYTIKPILNEKPQWSMAFLMRQSGKLVPLFPKMCIKTFR